MRVAVIGGGAFGTSISHLLGTKGFEVRLWVRDPALIESINRDQENSRYLKGVRLPASVRAYPEPESVLEGAELVVAATPSQVAREVFTVAAPWIPERVPIVTLSKGIEEGSLLLPTEVLEHTLPERYHPHLAALSGPSFAKEVAAGSPTAVTVAAHAPKVAQRIQELLSAPSFRCYTSPDVIGIQLGGALKNVMAIGSGISDGLGFGSNARAALITRGLTEITRVAVARGGNPITLSGLSGLGDLVLTCTGDLSRNRQVGIQLGQGRKLPEILRDLGQVAEGVATASSARELANRLGVEVPITEQVHRILHGGVEPRQAVTELMTRELKPEFRG